MNKRELVTPHEGDSCYVQGAGQGRFAAQDDLGRSLEPNRASKAGAMAKPGQGDRSGQKPR